MEKELNPKVSIVIPTFGERGAKYVSKAIKSVLNQTFQNFEIIIVDDNNSENIKRKIKDIVKKFDDTRLKYKSHNSNKGLDEARNTGIEESNGEYIAFLDDDDIFLEKKLEEHVKKLNDSDEKTVLTYAQHKGIDNKNNYEVVTPKKNIAKSGNIYDYLLFRYFSGRKYPFTLFQIWDAVLKKHFLTNMKFEDKDDDFILRLSKKGRFIFIPEILHIQNLEGERISTTKCLDSDEYRLKKILKKHRDYMEKKDIEFDLKRRKSLTYIVKASRLIRSNNIVHAQKLLIESIKTKFSFYSVFIFLLSFTGKKFFVKILKIRQNIFL